MEKYSEYRRRQSTAALGGDFPRLLIRGRSGSTVTSSDLPQTHSFTSSRNSRREENPGKNTKKKEATDAVGMRFMPLGIEVPRRTRSASTSPSAWALSPGRRSHVPACFSPAPMAVPKSPASCEKLMKKEAKAVGRGVTGVLKYLIRQKKVSPLLEEEYHRYRLMYNRLLQWRSANARAEESMAAVERVAQKKVLNGWVRISTMRKVMVEKQSGIEKLKQGMKLYQILTSEMGLLNEWRKIEAKNVESVGRVVRKLSAISHCLPLVHNAQVDINSVHDSVSTALGVMDNIKAMILDKHWQVEKTCFLLTELSVTLKQHKQFFQELENRLTLLASLEAKEGSLRVHRIQLVKEVE